MNAAEQAYKSALVNGRAPEFDELDLNDQMRLCALYELAQPPVRRGTYVEDMVIADTDQIAAYAATGQIVKIGEYIRTVIHKRHMTDVADDYDREQDLCRKTAAIDAEIDRRKDMELMGDMS